ncbi:hypothetical protein [Paraburkholderia phenoliruptrix]|uniref:hypothetical protein n=1 Tax=Paraburkholderia phenoliruptrix TaxID=252970 RepID=UPI0034CFE435
MISMVTPLPIGNALKVFLVPPAGALAWRVLRKDSNTFTDQNDAGAYVAFDGSDKYFVDASFLQNEVQYFYCAFYFDGTNWTASAPVSATCHATYQDQSSDALTLLRDRLEAGFAVEVARGVFSPASGGIAVLTAPPQVETMQWPVISVHLTSEQPTERLIGELYVEDYFDSEIGKWNEAEGWLANVQIAVIAWTQNPDERIALRQALRRIVIGNLPVFDAAGLTQIDFSVQDVDAISGEYPAPVYQAAGTFSCVAPVLVGDQVAQLSDVQVTVSSPN